MADSAAKSETPDSVMLCCTNFSLKLVTIWAVYTLPRIFLEVMPEKPRAKKLPTSGLMASWLDSAVATLFTRIHVLPLKAALCSRQMSL